LKVFIYFCILNNNLFRRMKRLIIAFACVLTLPFMSHAQQASDLSSQSLACQADSLLKVYKFDDALRIYEKAVAAQGDSLLRIPLEDKKTMAENGIALRGFVCTPAVVASHKFSVKDFFLFYPLQDMSWHKLPNKLDSLTNHPIVNATYVPQNTTRLCYSTRDEDECRNLYWTEKTDSSWTAPTLLNEGMISTGDEIYPMLSPDGKTLYFASNGLYGVGGYDLFESQWDEENSDWGIPVNLGFPFSSPADDFLYIDSEDGNYSIFASNRDCSKDSVIVYVVEFDNMPLHKAIEDPAELQQLSHLLPGDKQNKIYNGSAVNNDMPDNVDTRNYVTKMKEVRILKDSLSKAEKMLDDSRSRLAASDSESERVKLTEYIIEKESALPFIQDAVQKANEELQKIEMDFLFKGVILDPDKLMEQASHEVVGGSSSYSFTGMHFGNDLSDMPISKPVRNFDYSFKIMDVGRFAEDNTLPGGLVYQIQLFSLSTKATVDKLKGISPVFEDRSSGRYAYRAGVFRRYNSALEQLNKVKRVGFRNAIICAFKDGKSLSIYQAKKIEAATPDTFKITIIPGGETLPADIVTIIRQGCDKDVVKSFDNGRLVFIIGPFTDAAEAENLAGQIQNAGMSNVAVSIIDNE